MTSLAGAFHQSPERWQYVLLLLAVALFTSSPVAALVQTNAQARVPLVRMCGTPTLGKTAATAVQQELNATMKVRSRCTGMC